MEEDEFNDSEKIKKNKNELTNIKTNILINEKNSVYNGIFGRLCIPSLVFAGIEVVDKVDSTVLVIGSHHAAVYGCFTDRQGAC